MPVIRYRTRDLTRLLPGTVTAMRRFAKITGRTDDMLIIRGVNVFPSQIEELILKCPGLAPHYEIEIIASPPAGRSAGDRGGPAGITGTPACARGADFLRTNSNR